MFSYRSVSAKSLTQKISPIRKISSSSFTSVFRDGPLPKTKQTVLLSGSFDIFAGKRDLLATPSNNQAVLIKFLILLITLKTTLIKSCPGKNYLVKVIITNHPNHHLLKNSARYHTGINHRLNKRLFHENHPQSPFDPRVFWPHNVVQTFPADF